MSSTNRGGQRMADDFYATPAWATDAILPHLVIPEAAVVLDPCAGEGAILKRLLPSTARLSAMEIDRVRGTACGAAIAEACWIRDALSLETWKRAGVSPDVVLTNPPFSLAMAFIERALEEVTAGGTVAMLLRIAFLASQKRADFHRAHPSDLYVLPKRPSFTPDGKTDSADYAWFVWGPGRIGQVRILTVEA